MKNNLEALVREYGNVPAVGPGRCSKDVMAEIMALAQPQPQPADQSWRVAEFWSSANPNKKVLCLAVGVDIVEWAKRSDFIRWVSP